MMLRRRTRGGSGGVVVVVACSDNEAAVGEARRCCSGDDGRSIDGSWDSLLRRGSRTRWSPAVVADGDIEVKCCLDETSPW
jgi:hypothetical protein